MYKKIYLIILFLMVLIFSTNQLVVSETALGTFTTSNTAPNQPYNLSIRDGSASWDNASLDTHDITPDIRWNVTDPEFNPVTTHICIANSTTFIAQFIAGNSGNCSNTTAATGITYSNIGGLKFNSTNTTYYITLIPDDGTLNGTELNATFYFIDQLPVASTLNITQVHDQTPTISWAVTDADDGTDDRWPADTFNHYLWVGNNTIIDAYFTNTSADNDSTIINYTLPWGTPGADWANRTINVTIGVDDTYLNSSSNFTQTFTLYDYLPHINSVFITSDGGTWNFSQSCQADASYCALTPLSHDNVTLAVRLNVTDTDNDCSGTNQEAWIMICLNATGGELCNEANPSNVDYSFDIDSVIAGGTDECIFTFSVNKTNADGTVEFFRAPGDYKLNINVTSQAGERTNQTNSNASWQYGTLSAINYSSIVQLGSASTTLGQWNDGATEVEYNVTNWGNAILNLDWNASDPITDGDNWPLNGTDFAIDDDNSQSTDSGDITLVYLNGTLKSFNHTTGLERCVTWDCDDTNTNETLATYYHIYPTLGLAPGTYNSTITIVRTAV